MEKQNIDSSDVIANEADTLIVSGKEPFEGEELYLIIPISTCESVSVNEWICDVTNGDDAVSNLQVIILTEKNGKSIFLDYHPGLSMQNKKLIPSEEPPILDFTVY